MTSVFTARRRAEEFNSLVEHDSTGDAPDARLAEWLEVVTLLRATPAQEPRAEFSADLRQRLMNAADSLLVPSEDTRRLTIPPRRTARDRRIAAAVGGIAIVGATSSLALAAQSALPGDMLYPLKRAMEDAGTGIRATDGARGVSLLASATDRLDEATALSLTGDLDEVDHVETALVDFADQATEASDLLLAEYAETGDKDSIEELRGFTAESMDSLVQLEAVLPEQARDELRHAVRVLDEIDDAAARACPSCRGGIDQIPSVLLVGQLAESELVVVPDAVVPGTSISQPGTGDGKQGGDGTSPPAGGTTTLPDWDGVTSSSPGPSGGNTGGDDSAPLGELTDDLASPGGQQTTGDGLTGEPGLDDELDAALEDVEDVEETLPDLP